MNLPPPTRQYIMYPLHGVEVLSAHVFSLSACQLLMPDRPKLLLKAYAVLSQKQRITLGAAPVLNFDYRGTSFIRRRPPPRTLCTVSCGGPKGWAFSYERGTPVIRVRMVRSCSCQTGRSSSSYSWNPEP